MAGKKTLKVQQVRSVIGYDQRQRPRSGDAEMVHGLAAKVLAQRRAQRLDRIAAAVREAQQSETVRSRILDLGMEPGTETPAQLVELIQRETAKNEKTISAIGLAKQ